jgi:hypothetical protein
MAKILPFPSKKTPQPAQILGGRIIYRLPTSDTEATIKRIQASLTRINELMDELKRRTEK